MLALCLSKGRQPRRGIHANHPQALHPCPELAEGGQYHESALPGGEGLSYYGARWYDPKLGRFLSADTIVPDFTNPQDFNRFAYVRNNPLGFQDPTGNTPENPIFDELGGGGGGGWPGAFLSRVATGATRTITRIGGATAAARVASGANRIANSNGLKQLRAFFSSGVPPRFQRAMGQAMSEGDYFSVRGFRPRTAIITENFFGPKTQAMSESNPTKWILSFRGREIFDTGIRVKDGVRQLSDIDVGWVYSGAQGRFMGEREFKPIQDLVNRVLYPTLQNTGIMTHGDQYSGLAKPNTALTVKHLTELTHVFKIESGQAVYQYSAPWRDTVFRMLEQMGQGPTIVP